MGEKNEERDLSEEDEEAMCRGRPATGPSFHRCGADAHPRRSVVVERLIKADDGERTVNNKAGNASFILVITRCWPLRVGCLRRCEPSAIEVLVVEELVFAQLRHHGRNPIANDVTNSQQYSYDGQTINDI